MWTPKPSSRHLSVAGPQSIAEVCTTSGAKKDRLGASATFMRQQKLAVEVECSELRGGFDCAHQSPSLAKRPGVRLFLLPLWNLDGERDTSRLRKRQKEQPHSRTLREVRTPGMFEAEERKQ